MGSSQESKHLNGTCGELVTPLNERGRWRAKLHSGDIKAVKTANLEIYLPTGSDEDDAAEPIPAGTSSPADPLTAHIQSRPRGESNSSQPLSSWWSRAAAGADAHANPSADSEDDRRQIVNNELAEDWGYTYSAGTSSYPAGSPLPWSRPPASARDAWTPTPAKTDLKTNPLQPECRSDQEAGPPPHRA